MWRIAWNSPTITSKPFSVRETPYFSHLPLYHYRQYVTYTWQALEKSHPLCHLDLLFYSLFKSLNLILKAFQNLSSVWLLQCGQG